MSVDSVKTFLDIRCLENFYTSEEKPEIEAKLKEEVAEMVKAKNEFYQIVGQRICTSKTVEEAKGYYARRKKVMKVVAIITSIVVGLIVAGAIATVLCALPFISLGFAVPLSVVLQYMWQIVIGGLIALGTGAGSAMGTCIGIQGSNAPEILTKEQRVKKKKQIERLKELAETYLEHAKNAQGLILNGSDKGFFSRLLDQESKKTLSCKERVAYIKPYMEKHLKLEGDRYPDNSMAVHAYVRKHLTETTPMINLNKIPMTEYKYINF